MCLAPCFCSAAADIVFELPTSLLLHGELAFADPVYGSAFKLLWQQQQQGQQQQQQRRGHQQQHQQQDEQQQQQGQQEQGQQQRGNQQQQQQQHQQQDEQQQQGQEWQEQQQRHQQQQHHGFEGLQQDLGGLEGPNKKGNHNPENPSTSSDAVPLDMRSLLVLLLVVERCRGPASFWYPYISFLPETYGK